MKWLEWLGLLNPFYPINNLRARLALANELVAKLNVECVMLRAEVAKLEAQLSKAAAQEVSLKSEIKALQLQLEDRESKIKELSKRSPIIAMLG